MIDRKIKMNEVTEKGYIELTFEGLESLEEFYGSDWYKTCLEGLDGYRVPVFLKMLEICLHDTAPRNVLKVLPLQTVIERLLNALSLVVHGYTIDEYNTKNRA